jgi:oxygen-independent coproporphyrinogen-3 oxidase
MIDEYIDKLLSDMDETFNAIKTVGLKLSTIYIGGGTPTTLSAKQLTRIFKKIKEHIDPFLLDEFTLEAGRPDTITADKLSAAKKYGVTRVSVNPQTLNNDLLRDIGRKHTVEEFYKAYTLAQKSGIRDINVDLIAGLPGDDFKNFSETMDKIIELKPSNITVHSFSVKKAADVLRKNSDIYSLAGHDAQKCVSYSQLKAKFSGYKPYYMYRQKNTVGNLENVGFSVEGHEGLYNIFMMEEVQSIFAVGAGAVTKLVKSKKIGDSDVKIERIFNPKYPYEYLKNDIGAKKKSFTEQVLEFYNEQK